ncbi:MAG: heparinase II/III-family protein, partial [Planctomycetota bacterium]|nr:heparinase II/III-family protein [Planctomycetota bacterium]
LEAPDFSDGRDRSKCAFLAIRETTGADWPRELVTFHVRTAEPYSPASIRVVDRDGKELPFQISGADEKGFRVAFFAELKAGETRVYRCFFDTGGYESPTILSPLHARTRRWEKGNPPEVLVLDTGAFRLALPKGDFEYPGDGAPLPEVPAPIVAVGGLDIMWAGRGAMEGKAAVKRISVAGIESGPLRIRYAVTYQMAGGGEIRYEIAAAEGEPCATVEEKSDFDGEGAFVLSGEGIRADRFVRSLWWETRDEAIAFRGDLPLAEIRHRADPGGESCLWMGVYDSKGGRDMLALFLGDAGRWADERAAAEAGERKVPAPGSPAWGAGFPRGSRYGRIEMKSAGPGTPVRFVAPFFRGSRSYGIAVADKRDCSPLQGGGRYRPGGSPVSIARARHSEGSLDRYKDMILEFGDPPGIRRPVAAVRRDRWGAIRASLETPRFRPDADELRAAAASRDPRDALDRALAFMLDGAPATAFAAKRDILDRLQALVRSARTGRGADPQAFGPWHFRWVAWSACAYDILSAAGALDANEEAAFRRCIAFLSELAFSRSFLDYAYGCGDVGMEMDRLFLLAAAARTFPGHPRCREWMDHAAEGLRTLFARHQVPKGNWDEGLWAVPWRAESLAWLVHMLEGFADPLADSRVRDFLALPSVAVGGPEPSDPAVLARGFGGGAACESLPRIRKILCQGGGTVGVPPPASCAFLALALQRYDPKAADALFSAWEAGGFFRGMERPRAAILLAGRPEAAGGRAAPPAPGNVVLPGLGVIMRRNVDSASEACVTFRCGPPGTASSGHRDMFSFSLYAGARPVVPDLGAGGEASDHATIERVGKGAFAGGSLTSFFRCDAAAFVQAAAPAESPGDIYEEAREVPEGWEALPPGERAILVRSLLLAGDDYLLVADRCRAAAPMRWHLPVLADSVARAGNMFRFRGRLGLDLAAIVLAPSVFEARESGPVAIPAVAGGYGAGNMPAVRRLTLGGPPRSPYVVVLQWLPPGAEPAKTATLEGGWKLTGGRFEDVLVFSEETISKSDADAVVEGRFALLRKIGGRREIILLDGTAAGWPDFHIRTDAPEIAVRITEEGAVSGEYDGAARTVEISAMPGFAGHAKATLDGRTLAAQADGNVIRLTLPAGRHVFELRR